jgi:hypothetical protein
MKNSNTRQQMARNSNGITAKHEDMVKQFVAERDVALLSLDEQIIRTHNQKWGVQTPSNLNVFWISIHKARTACRSLPREARMLSKKWLNARGYQSSDCGELDVSAA